MLHDFTGWAGFWAIRFARNGKIAAALVIARVVLRVVDPAEPGSNQETSERLPLWTGARGRIERASTDREES